MKEGSKLKPRNIQSSDITHRHARDSLTDVDKFALDVMSHHELAMVACECVQKIMIWDDYCCHYLSCSAPLLISLG